MLAGENHQPLSVVEDILKYRFSKEVEAITSQDYYRKVKDFNSIFGCGPVED
jgi:hypothetical protein